MSKVVDERVVEMRFDNRHFEQNVSHTMSTLEKLKAKLNFSGATKGLSDLTGHTSIVKKNMDVLGQGVKTVQGEFSSLSVIGATCLVNITNAAIRAGKNIVNALTLDPVKTGFQEYETKINAIQTILANTSSKGENIESVTRVIDELNTYADKTIYNFSEMTRNIGTFTAAGVGLQESADAIQGIANVAAMSGSTSQQASTAMYQLSQALAAGTVKLMDWNSVVTAGMGGEKLQEALKQTAREFGTDVDSMIESAGSFRESLSEGWITADVLNTTLRKFTVEGAKEYAQSMLECGKYTQEQADALIKEAQTAEDAATKVKTLTQLWDTLKETAQSGWGKTWELIIGDFEEAKTFFTKLSDMFGPMIDRISDARNKLIEGALSSKWEQFTAKIEAAGVSMDTFKEKLKEVAAERGLNLDKLIENYGSLAEVIRRGRIPTDAIVETLRRLAGVSDDTGKATGDLTKKLEEFQNIVDRVWQGDFGNGADRVKALTDAGYEYEKVQNLVNKSIDGYRLKVDDLSDAQLEAIGYTKEEIKAIRELADEAGNINFQAAGGRELLLDSLMNAIKGVVKLCSTLKQAWQEIFPPMTSDRLYSIIEGINEFSKKLIMSDETAEKLKRTFKGVFAVIDVVTTLLGSGLKLAVKVVSEVLSYFNLDILDVTAYIGDALVSFRDWVDSIVDVKGAIEAIMPFIESMISKVKEYIEIFKTSDNIPGDLIAKLKEDFGSGFEKIKSIFGEGIEWIRDKLSTGLGFLSEFFSGIVLDNSVLSSIAEFGKGIIEKITDGLQNGLPGLLSKVQELIDTVLNYIKGINPGMVAGGFLMGGVLFTINKFIDAFGGIGELAEKIGEFVESLGAIVKGIAFDAKARGILKLAIAVGVLAGSIYILAKLDADELQQGLLAIVGVVSLLIILAYATSKLGTATDTIAKTGGILMLAGALLIMAAAIKIMSGIDAEGFKNAVKSMILALGSLVVLMIIVDDLTKSAAKMSAAGTMLLKMAAAMLIMVYVIKIASGLDKGEVLRGIEVVGMVELLFLAAIKVSQCAGEYGSVAGSMLLKMSVAFLVMLLVIKLASKLSIGEVNKAIKTLAKIELLFLAAIAVSKLAGANGVSAGTMLLGMSVAFLIMGYAIKNMAKIPESDVDKAIGIIKKIGIMFGALLIVSRFSGGNAAKAGAMLVTMSAAMLILSGAMLVMSLVPTEKLPSIVDAISQIIFMMSILVAASGLAGNAKGTIIAIAVTLAILSGTLIALAFIPTERLMPAVEALSIVMLSLAAVFAAAGQLAKVKMGKIIATMVLMGLLIAGIAYVLNEMSKLGVENALENAAGLGILLLAMSGSMLILNKIGEVNADTAKALLAMAGLAAILELLALVLATMTALNVQNGIENSLALVILLGAMSLAMIPVSKMGELGPKILIGVGALAIMALVMEMLALVLATMTALNVQNGIENALALSILLGAMAIAMIPIGLLGTLGPSMLIGVGALAIMALVMELLALVLATMTALNVQNGIENALALSILLGAMALAMIPLGLMGILGPSILIGVGALAIMSLVMEILALVLATMSALDVQNGVENAKALGILVLALSAACVPLGLIGILGPSVLIGAAMLALVAAVLELAILAFQKFIAPGLPEMGVQLSMFAISLMPFIAAMKMIDDSAVAGCKNVASMFLALAESAAIDAVMSLFGGNNWTSGIKDQLVSFGEAMVAFSNTLTEGNFNAEAVNAAANAGQILAALQDSMPKSGGKINEIMSSIVGENDMTGFGTQLESFGKSMVAFSKSVEGINPTAIEAAKDAGLMLTELADTIPNSGGILAEFLGDNTMDTFGTQLESFGKSMSAFSKSITGDNAIDSKAVEEAAKAGKALAEMANEIPNEGGWISKLVGDNQIDTFGDKLPKLGKGLAGFGEEVKNVEPKPIKAAAEAAKALAEMAANIPNEGGWISKLVGDNKLDTFADNIGKLGTGMKTFSDNTKGMSTANIKTAATAAGDIKTVIDNLPSSDAMKGKIDEKGIQKLDAVLPSLMTTLKTASSSISGISTSGIATAVGEVDKLVNMLTKIGSTNFSGTDSFVTAINDLGKVAIDKFVNAFKNGASRASTAAQDMLNKVIERMRSKSQTFTEAGRQLMNKFAEGIKGGVSQSVSAVTSALTTIITAAKMGYYPMLAAGGYLMQGLASGISGSSYIAAQAATAAMNSAITAAKAAAGINSPSKVFYEMGGFVVAGFTNALDDMGNKVYDSGYSMADNATKGFSNAIGRITSSFDEDSLQPTIRPVLDLSSVQAGAGTINSMFSMTPSVGLLSNIGAIGSMMANRQNGASNDDVVYAIDKLRKEIGNVGGTTNYINGITYDDGSNVSDAVATLVRAARIERRR